MNIMLSQDIKKHFTAFVCVYMVGFILGIIGTNLLHKEFQYPSNLLGMYFMSKADPDYSAGKYFCRLLENRGAWFLFYGVGGVTFFGVPLVVGGLLWLGFLAGSLLTMFLMEYGIRVLLLGSACFVPQCFFYIPATLSFFFIVYQMSQKFWKRQSIGRKRYQSYIFFLMAIGIVYLCGIFMESYVNYKVLVYVKTLL